MNNVSFNKQQRPRLNNLARGILCALTFGGLITAGHEAVAAQEFVPGRILVQPLPGLAQKDFGKIVGEFGGKSAKHLDKINVHVINVEEGREDEFVELLSRHPHIAHVEKDRIVEPSVTPNDPWIGYQWHLTKIMAPTAWDSTKGSSTVTVAVLDTGVDATHPDLAGKLVAGWNVASNNADTSPVAGHGTQVAGVIGAVSDNGVGVASVGWNTLVQPVRVTNDPSGAASLSSLADGIVWAADHGAKVANISYNMGWGCNAFILDGAAQYFRSKGGVVVTAAGNDGTNQPCAEDPYLIIVSATDSNDALPTWSNYGAFVDIAAPGSSIFTTVVGGGYGGVSGTSFSTPITAGVVALMMAANPNLSSDQYESVLKQSADNPGGGPRPNPYFGWGRVNAANAVANAMNYVPTDTTPPTTAIVSPGNGAKVAGTQVVSVSAQDNVSVAKVQFYANNQLVGESTTGPTYQFSWNTETVADGNVPLVSYAYDSAGNRGASEQRNVTVSNVPATPTVVTLTSVSTEDGWVLESTETSNVGGSIKSNDNTSKGLLLGDNNKKQQYKSILSFDTSALPDNATIISAKLRLNRGNLTGISPFTTHGDLQVDIQTGGFTGNAALEKSDFQSPASAYGVATMSNAATNGAWSEGWLNATGLTTINKTGKTQFRLQFYLDDDNDGTNDYVGFYAGENSTPTSRPQLVVTYQ